MTKTTHKYNSTSPEDLQKRANSFQENKQKDLSQDPSQDLSQESNHESIKHNSLNLINSRRILHTLKSPSKMFSSLLSLPVHIYRLFISPILPNSCRFTPSCSSYALQALSIHGPIVGSWLIVKRLVRCHPWGGQGFDPVPPKKYSKDKPENQSNKNLKHLEHKESHETHSSKHTDDKSTTEKFFRSNQVNIFHHKQQDVSITAEPEFLLHHSIPEQEHFVWRCNITIHNKSESPLRLIRHNWQITGNDGSSFNVSDDQTSSNQPVLIKGVALLHSCTVPICTPSALISGSYEMLDAKGQIVTINTPTFSLDSPWDEQHIN